MRVSNCCNAPTVENSEDYGLCVKCQEHCEFWDDEEDYDDNERRHLAEVEAGIPFEFKKEEGRK